MHSPWAGGVILVAFAVLALILANIPQTAGVYHHLLESHLTVGFDHFRLSKPLEAWINDGLMVIFFSMSAWKSNARSSPANFPGCAAPRFRWRRRSEAWRCLR